MTKSKSIKSFIFWPVVFFGLILVCFFVFRLINLNIIPVFVDEAIYVRWSQVMRNEATLRFLPLSDGKQPLFMWITIPFLKFISDPLIAARMVSVFSGLGSLIGVSIFSWLLFGNITTSIIAALLYAVVPFTVFFDRMALADSLLNMFGIWSLVFSIIFARTRRLDVAMILGFIIGGGLITKSPAIIFYLWIIIALAFFARINQISKRQILEVVAGLVAVFLVSQGINSILRLGPGFSMIGSRNQDYVFSLKEVLIHPLNPLIGNLKSTLNWLWLLFTPPVFIISFFSLLNKKKIWPALFVFLICLLPLFAQGAIAKVYTSRYIMFASIPLLSVAASGFYWVLIQKKVILNLLILLMILTPIFVSAIYITNPQSAPMTFDMRSGYLQEWTAGVGNKEIANYIIDLESQGKKIVVFTEGYFGTMPDGLQIYTEGHPNITIVGSPPNVSRLPDGLINSAKTNMNFFVVNKSRNKLKSADLEKLILIKEFPKASRLDGTQEVLQFYLLK